MNDTVYLKYIIIMNISQYIYYSNILLECGYILIVRHYIRLKLTHSVNGLYNICMLWSQSSANKLQLLYIMHYLCLSRYMNCIDRYFFIKAEGGSISNSIPLLRQVYLRQYRWVCDLKNKCYYMA